MKGVMKGVTVPALLRDRTPPTHAAEITAQLGPLTGGDYTPGVAGLLLLCFTNRSGSNHLAALLASTGAFNEAGEFFNADTVLHHARARALSSLRQYLSILPALVEGAGRWLAAKTSLDQLIMLADAGILDAHPAARFILIERQDLLAQAISRCIAAQNDRWTRAQRAEIPDHDIIYDRAAIERTLHDVAQTNAGFRAFFAANDIAPLHLAHEHIAANPHAAVARIGNGLGIPGLKPGVIRLRPQATSLNSAWRTRFKAGQ